MRSGAIPLSFSKVKWRERGMSLLGSVGGVVQGRSRLKAECSAVRGKGRNGGRRGREKFNSDVRKCLTTVEARLRERGVGWREGYNLKL